MQRARNGDEEKSGNIHEHGTQIADIRCRSKEQRAEKNAALMQHAWNGKAGYIRANKQ